ncbi:MAG: FlgD immunoglobulin-like domain containing protein, partial [Nocardioidaceae bacterium]
AAPAESSVVVDNGVPAVSAPTAGQEIRGETVHAAATVAGGSVLFTIGAERALDLTAPFEANLRVEKLTDGTHTVGVVGCRSDGQVCDGGHPAQVPVRVSRLHPGVTSVSPRAISPDGDGVRDAATVTYRLDSRQAARLVVRDAETRAVLYRRGLGTQPAGSHTATWKGRTSSGKVAPDGYVTLQIATSDGTLEGSASSRPVRVDRTAPRLRGAALSSARLLPVRDDYLDSTVLSARLREQVRRVELQVRTGAGALVRQVRVADPRDSLTPSAVWDGRTAGGQAVAAGRYVLRLVATDLAGNVGRSAGRSVTVSAQRLVKRSSTTNVTARESLLQTYEDDCSQVFRRTSGAHRGWVGYSASSLCTSGDAYAAADHQVRLPAAVRYGTVRISAYGGRGDKRYRDSATVVYYDSLQNLSERSLRLGPSVGTYAGPRVAAAPLVIRSRVLRWMTITTGVSWYDVRSYRVDVTYFALR